ncbi:XdhC family aldehyde oxidoreductase maturation factor [Desulfopila aestuarii]|uniref:Xanthine dehydrogenase accessory factor n=1 Tax=Desulfopila aestuarii DSM 18488 TaxID=1121416 RepID=A0A1M7XWN0_9BACT|nr:XdhC/CoxI family protein [Desulfopila aestuarii]SHO43192.1 xanthine dehydrogenase accessory factor [Desulfopila aestuarii DSM 18488]
MRHVLDHLVETLNRDESAILCTIIRNTGSAPRTSGARMLVTRSGALAGSIGGGALENACQARARQMFESSETFAEMTFQLTATLAAKDGLICGGNVSILLMRIEPEQHPFFVKLQETYRSRKRPLLVTALAFADVPPQLTLVTSDERGELPTDIWREILRQNSRHTSLTTYAGREYFIEPLLNPGTVYLAGAGHVGLATATCAAFAGFDVVVMDDRAEFANRSRFPKAHDIRLLSSFNNCLPKELGAEDYVVILTRGHLHDRNVLAQALNTDAGYIGMIGSRRKREAIYRSLRDEGVSEAELQRVHSPIGLDIGADTPEEIGISIVAQLIQTRAGTRQ